MPTESFFSSASLAYLASAGAGKDGKTYSIKPTDGSGDFTFSRGSNLAATRVGPTGLIEKGRENLLKQSNNFGTTWLTTNASVTSGQSGYDGSSDAWLLDISGGANSQQIRQSVTASGVTSYSIYAKANTLDWILLYVDASQNTRGYFDIANGVLGGANNLIDSKIESVGNGYYRCTIVCSDSITQVRLYLASGDGSIAQSSGSIYIQDAQLEIGLAATDYIESGATTGKAGLLEDEPRFDYSGGATCPSLLLEPSRTNLIGYSEYFEGSDWTKTAAGTGSLPVITSNYGTSPEGLQNASRLQMNLNGGTASGDRSLLTYFLTAIAPATNSFYLKSLGGDTTMTFRCGSTIKSILVTSEWQRFNATDAAGTDRLQLRLYGDRDSQSADLLIYGAQLEQASYPTSYIPNHSGGSVTRGADDCQVEDLQSNGIVGNTWTYFFEWGDYVAERNFEMKDSTSFNFLFMVSRLIRYIKQDTSADTLFSLPTNGTSLKALISYDGTTLKGYLNGSLINSVNDAQSSSFSDFDFLRLDRSFDDTEELKQLLIFPEALSDADCITLTTL